MENFQTQVLDAFRDYGSEMVRLNREDSKGQENAYNEAHRESVENTFLLIDNGGFSIR